MREPQPGPENCQKGDDTTSPPGASGQRPSLPAVQEGTVLEDKHRGHMKDVEGRRNDRDREAGRKRNNHHSSRGHERFQRGKKESLLKRRRDHWEPGMKDDDGSCEGGSRKTRKPSKGED